MNKIRLTLLASTVAAAAIVAPSHGVETAPCKAIRLGGLPDFTGSMNDGGHAVFSLREVNLMISALKHRCGELAVGMIVEKSKRPLARLPIEPVVGRLNERAAINSKNRNREAEFIEEIKARLARTRDAQKTDVYGALRRFKVFFDEPAEVGTEKHLIVASDGVDSTVRPKAVLPTDVSVYAVGMERPVAEQWFGKNVVVVESFDAAVKQLNQKSKK